MAEEGKPYYSKYIKNVPELPYPLFQFDKETREKGEALSPLKTIEELEDEFSEWICKIGVPTIEQELIEKFLFFCKIKGEAKNL